MLALEIPVIAALREHTYPATEAGVQGCRPPVSRYLVATARSRAPEWDPNDGIARHAATPCGRNGSHESLRRRSSAQTPHAAESTPCGIAGFYKGHQGPDALNSEQDVQ